MTVLLYALSVVSAYGLGQGAVDQIVEKNPGWPALAGRPVSLVRYDGMRVTQPGLLDREMVTRSSVAFEPRAFAEDLVRLERLSIFSSVTPAVTPVGDSVLIVLVLHELPPALVHPNAHITAQNGLSLGAGARFINLFGWRHQPKAWLMMGGSFNTGVEYYHPWLFGDHISNFTMLHYIRRDNSNDGFREKVLRAEFWLGKDFSWDTTLRLGGGFFLLGSDSADVLLSTAATGKSRQDFLPHVGFRIHRDTRDAVKLPRAGGYEEFSVERYGAPLGSLAGFWRVIVDIQHFFPLSKAHTLVAGALLTMQHGTVPIYLDYEIGGVNTVRGWEEDSRRGANQWLTTIEYRWTALRPKEFKIPFGFHFSLGLDIVALADAGTAWGRAVDQQAQRSSSDFGQWISGAGVGVHILMPVVERIRFEYVLGRGTRALFAFDIDPKFERQRDRLR